MQVEITPEPSSEERAAIAAAVEVFLAREDGVGVWWEAGARENVEDPEPNGLES